MPLKISISGIRGTIGTEEQRSLVPREVVNFAGAYAMFLKQRVKRPLVVTGRDGRDSGLMVLNLIKGTLMACGVDIADCGYATTPTMEMVVQENNADGGIIITASHNPSNWNALKLLNEKGEFLSANDGNEINRIIQDNQIHFVKHEYLGKEKTIENALEMHIQKILALPLVDIQEIKKAKFKVAYDAINSVGAIALPALLNALGVEAHFGIHTGITGQFEHNPEPNPENLQALKSFMLDKQADVAFAVDPDVDRLAIVCENGGFFGEEYTLVAVADYILKNGKGNTVSNLSSSRALRDVTDRYGGNYSAAAVGEVNVVDMMKENNAIIGGEGNGGVIYPELHYGRDALVGIALFLSLLAKEKKKCSELKKDLPHYEMVKEKMKIPKGIDLNVVFKQMAEEYEEVNLIDGLKIDFEKSWVHIRASNTEPIIRIYAEAKQKNEARVLVEKIKSHLEKLIYA